MQIKRERTYEAKANRIEIDHVGTVAVQWAVVDELGTPSHTDRQTTEKDDQPEDVAAAVATLTAWAASQAEAGATGKFADEDAKIAEALAVRK